MTWQLASFAMLAITIAAGFAWYERAKPSAKLLALVATLAALAALGRVAFAPIPGVKPTTDIILIAGYTLGGAPGFVVGAVGALASNVFFGQGPFTPWQMAGWGAVGVFGALLARVFGRGLGVWPLAAVCAVAGLAYGSFLDLHLWVLYSGHTPEELLVLAGRGVPFNVAHAAGNVVFCLAFGPLLVRALERYRDRLEVVWHPLPAAGLGAILAALAVALGVAGPATDAHAADRAQTRAAGYLAKAQNADGGFGADRGRGSDQLYTSWAVIGLAAAGRDPRTVKRNGRSGVDYIVRNLGRSASHRRHRAHDPRALHAARRSPRGSAAATSSPSLRASAGATGRSGPRQPDGVRDPRVARGRQAALGSRDPRCSGLARRAAQPRRRLQLRGPRRLERHRRHGGGPPGPRRGGQALDQDGHACRGVPRRAPENTDGGLPLSPGGASNAQSTAWAIQALVAAGRNPDRLRRRGARSPLAYLRSLQSGSGAIRYSRTSTQSPVWVTAQALTGLARTPFPIR